MDWAPNTNAVMRVWVDRDLCTGCGCCTEIAPEIFVLTPAGLTSLINNDFFVVDGLNIDSAFVPADLHARAREAAETCPGEVITIREF